MKHRWATWMIDTRLVEGINHELVNQWVEDFGEDSDYVRVRVRGVFPRAGAKQLIPQDIVRAAMKLEPTCTTEDPLIMGVDVARFGDDQSVLAFRKGRDARSIPWQKFRGVSNTWLAARVAELYDEYHVDAVFVDGGGNGGGVIDRLRQLGYPCIEVQFGAEAQNPKNYRNRRAEMWARMRDGLKHGVAIPDSTSLEQDLIGPEYDYDAIDRLWLEPKDKMKDRGLNSPDEGDALGLTWAAHVAKRATAGGLGLNKPRHQSEWNGWEN
jgi:hypothetical protein